MNTFGMLVLFVTCMPIVPNECMLDRCWYALCTPYAASPLTCPSSARKALPSSRMSSSIAVYSAPRSSNSCLAFTQNGHLVQLKTTTCKFHIMQTFVMPP
jgi:hypothetical protein